MSFLGQVLFGMIDVDDLVIFMVNDMVIHDY